MTTDWVRGDGALSGVSANTFILTDTPRPSARRGAQRDAGTSVEMPLRPAHVVAAWRSLQHPFVRMCINEISKRLFSGRGIAVHKNNEPKTPSAAFETFLRRDMTPFARDALNAILAQGVVPIAFRRPHTAGLGPAELAPYVPPPGSYTLTTWVDAGVQRYAFYWNTSPATASLGTPMYAHGELDTSVIIAHDFGFDPLITGELTSNMHVIATELRMVNELRSLLLVAERIASNPPLISTYNLDVERAAREAAGGKEPAFFATDLDRCRDLDKWRYERTPVEESLFAANVAGYGDMLGFDARGEFGQPANTGADAYERAARFPVEALDASGAEMPWARRHHLDVTQTPYAHTMPQTRSDYTQIMEQVMAIVCGVLNVPQGVLAASTSIKAGVEATAESMHRTVNHYADMLGALMTGVYHHIFGVADLRDELRSRVERRRRTRFDLAPQLLTEEDLFDARRVSRIRLSFDLPPTTTMEHLNYLRNRGIISWQLYRETALRLNNFVVDRVEDTSDPFTDAERKSLIVGESTAPAGPAAASRTRALHTQASSSSAPKKSKRQRTK